MLTFRVLIMLP